MKPCTSELDVYVYTTLKEGSVGETQGSVSSQIHPPFTPTKTTQADDGRVEIPAVTQGRTAQVCLAVCEAFGHVRLTASHVL